MSAAALYERAGTEAANFFCAVNVEGARAGEVVAATGVTQFPQMQLRVGSGGPNRVAAAALVDAAVTEEVADILIAVHAVSAAGLGKGARAFVANPDLAADAKAAAGERIAATCAG